MEQISLRRGVNLGEWRRVHESQAWKNLFKANCVAEYNEPMADAVM